MVVSKIEGAVVGFFETIGIDRAFHLEDLLWWVAAACGSVSPGSPCRVMRSLRQRGIVNYEVINRAKSAYAVREVPKE